MPLPFGYDLSQVFWGIMNKTMWDFRFGNMNYGGFNGGFMNSCWGGGFQMPMWGDSYNFSSTANGSSQTCTIEDEVDKRQLTRKQNALYNLLENYAKSLPEGTERDTIEVTLSRYKTIKQENYEALRALYEENKTKIQQKFDNGSKIEATQDSKAAATAFANSNPNFQSILKVDGEKNTTAELKDGVDAMGFLYSLQTTKKKSFKEIYNTAFEKADSTKRAEMKKVLQAVYKGLTAEANNVKEQDGVSEETKEAIGKLLTIEDSNATPDNVDQLYYWIRMAKAEVADSKYACLHEDFPNDPLLGKPANGVGATTEALKAEGFEPDKVRAQTIATNYDEMENDTARMSSLVEKGYQTVVTGNLLTELKKVAGVLEFLDKNGITQIWVDSKPMAYNQLFVRVIDKDGKLRCLTGVVGKMGQNDQITFEAIGQPLVGGAAKPGEIAFGGSITADQMDAQAKMADNIKAETGTLTELQTQDSKGRRVFEEKTITSNRNYKRLFIIDDDGNLKEWKNVRYAPRSQHDPFVTIGSDKASYVDASLDDIKTAVTAQPELNAKAEEAEAEKYLTTVDEQSKAIAESFYQALDGYTRDSDWQNFDKEMKNVNGHNVLVILKAYTEKQNEHAQTKWSFDRGFFEQIYKENTGRGRRNEIVNKMKTYILEYVDGRLPLIQNNDTKARITTLRDEISKLDTTSCCHETVETAKTLDKNVAELCQLFDIK